jgi:hypothetical protein
VLVFGWIISMIAAFGTILLFDGYGIAGDYALPLGVWFLVSFLGAPVMLAYIALKGLKLRWAEISVSSDPDVANGVQISYVDQNGRVHTEHGKEPRIRTSDALMLSLKTGSFHSLWIETESDEQICQVLSLAYSDLYKSESDLEATARIIYPFEFAFFEGAFIIAFFGSSQLWQQVMFGSLAIAGILFYFASYFYLGRYLFRIRGNQIISEAEDSNFIEKLIGRTIACSNVKSIKINRERKRIFFGSIYKIYYISLAENSQHTVNWFEEALSVYNKLK